MDLATKFPVKYLASDRVRIDHRAIVPTNIHWYRAQVMSVNYSQTSRTVSDTSRSEGRSERERYGCTGRYITAKWYVSTIWDAVSDKWCRPIISQPPSLCHRRKSMRAYQCMILRTRWSIVRNVQTYESKAVNSVFVLKIRRLIVWNNRCICRAISRNSFRKCGTAEKFPSFRWCNMLRKATVGTWRLWRLEMNAKRVGEESEDRWQGEW